MTILIKNGTVVNADKHFAADVLIYNGIIEQVAPAIEVNDLKDLEIIDAKGRYLFPGGIDPHVHMHLPTPAGFSSDDFYTGSKAALFGGTTTLIDFVTPHKGESLKEALHKRTAEAANSYIDYSFHVSPVEWRSSMPQEIKACLVNEGITSFKVYMAYKESIGLDDDVLKKVTRAVADAGGILTVHCEDGDEIEALRNQFYQEGKRTPHYHPLSRPPETEAEAVEKIIGFAAEAGCPLYIVHVSSMLSLHHIKMAQQNGQKVFAESCPHYLLLDDSKYEGTFEQTAPFMLSPPLRKKADNEALWEALADNTVQTVGTDHCSFTMEQKRMGRNDFRKIANGAGGVEHRMELLYTYGVLQNRISLSRFTAITSTNAAKIFGLYPQKGVIAQGSDADIVVWNPDTTKTISAKTHQMHCDSDIFEGFKITGSPEQVIANGKIIIRNGKWSGENIRGKFLYRKAE
ncbi:MAG: dihydropyrimidinase [Bacteroidetes bacterium]|nr:MAG: dihydropyrimidinase [Bacteroidota bacterium]